MFPEVHLIVQSPFGGLRLKVSGTRERGFSSFLDLNLNPSPAIYNSCVIWGK